MGIQYHNTTFILIEFSLFINWTTIQNGNTNLLLEVKDFLENLSVRLDFLRRF